MNKGKVNENVLKRSVLKYINDNGSAIPGKDCAFFTGISTDFDEESAGRMAMLRAVNNAAVCGKIAKDSVVSLFLPERYREIKLKAIVKDIGETAEKLGIRIVDGHTETISGITHPVVNITIHATEPMTDSEGKAWSASKPLPADAIIMTKWAAMSGAARIAKVKSEELNGHFPEFITRDAMELLRFISVVPEAAVAVSSDAVCMNDCSDGGVMAALWQLGDVFGVGLEVNLRNIPIMQESVEISDYYNLNPYKLRSDGALLIVARDGEAMTERLHEADIPAVIIGHITDGIDRVLVYDDERRYLEEPRQDEGCMIY